MRAFYFSSFGVTLEMGCILKYKLSQILLLLRKRKYLRENDEIRKTITFEILQQRYQYKTSRNVAFSELS